MTPVADRVRQLRVEHRAAWGRHRRASLEYHRAKTAGESYAAAVAFTDSQEAFAEGQEIFARIVALTGRGR